MDRNVEVQRPSTEVVDMLSGVARSMVPAKFSRCDEVVDMLMVPVVLRRQAPMIQEVLKTVEIAQGQYIGKIGDVSVVTERHIPTVQTAQKTEEVPKVQFLDPVAGVPVVMQRQLPQGPNLAVHSGAESWCSRAGNGETVGGSAGDRFPRQNPAADCGANR